MKVRMIAILTSASLLLGTFGFVQVSESKPRTYVVAMSTTTGGFVMPSYNFTRVPNFVIYSDGRMISTSEVTTAQYPSPSLPALRTKFVNGDLKRILGALEASKLTDPKFDWGFPNVADVPNTEVRTQLSAQKRSSRVSVYALGMSGPGVSKQQAKYRKKASAVLEQIQSFSNKYIWTKSMPTIWKPVRYAYQISEGEPTEFTTIQDWVGPVISAQKSCAVLSQADSAKITKLGNDINSETMWNSDGKTWRVSFRPLFPHESNCRSIGY